MTTDTRKGIVPSASQVPCWQWLITQYLISWDPITYYAECRTNKLKSTVSRLIDDTPNPAFVCSNVLMLVTTTKAWSDNAVCHSDGELPASYLSSNKPSFLVVVCVCKCMWLFVASLTICISYFRSVCEYIAEDISGTCQVVDPIKGRFPLFTLRACWFLAKSETGPFIINKNKENLGEILSGMSCFCAFRKFKLYVILLPF